MAHGFAHTPQGMRYEERISWPLRVLAGVIGLSMGVIPVPFLLHAHAGLPWWQLALAALCVVAPVLLGLLFLAIALGRCLRLHFDAARGLLLYTSRWPLGARDVPIALHAVGPATILERASEDGPHYVIALALPGRRPLHLGGFDDLEQARRWQAAIAQQLGAS